MAPTRGSWAGRDGCISTRMPARWGQWHPREDAGLVGMVSSSWGCWLSRDGGMPMRMLARRGQQHPHKDASSAGMAAFPRERQFGRDVCIPVQMLDQWGHWHPLEDAGLVGTVTSSQRCWLRGWLHPCADVGLVGTVASPRGCQPWGDGCNTTRTPCQGGHNVPKRMLAGWGSSITARMTALHGWLHPHEDTSLAGTSASPQGPRVRGSGDVPRFRGRGDAAPCSPWSCPPAVSRSLQ